MNISLPHVGQVIHSHFNQAHAPQPAFMVTVIVFEKYVCFCVTLSTWAKKKVSVKSSLYMRNKSCKASVLTFQVGKILLCGGYPWQVGIWKMLYVPFTMSYMSVKQPNMEL